MRLIVGAIFTLLYIFGFAYFLYANKMHASELELNEWGDLLAGLFSPLAFFWFILAYLQQSQEMKAGTEALKSQRDQQNFSAKLSAYTALLNHETKEHALFSSFGADYKRAAINARNRETIHKEQIETLLKQLEVEPDTAQTKKANKIR